jgi:hypothetical protein
MEMYFSDLQELHEDTSIRPSLEPDSKVNVEIVDSEVRKYVSRISTAAGTQIDFSDEQYVNTDPSIHASLELDSKVNVEREGQRQRHIFPRI